MPQQNINPRRNQTSTSHELHNVLSAFTFPFRLTIDQAIWVLFGAVPLWHDGGKNRLSMVLSKPGRGGAQKNGIEGAKLLSRKFPECPKIPPPIGCFRLFKSLSSCSAPCNDRNRVRKRVTNSCKQKVVGGDMPSIRKSAPNLRHENSNPWGSGFGARMLSLLDCCVLALGMGFKIVPLIPSLRAQLTGSNGTHCKTEAASDVQMQSQSSKDCSLSKEHAPTVSNSIIPSKFGINV